MIYVMADSDMQSAVLVDTGTGTTATWSNVSDVQRAALDLLQIQSAHHGTTVNTTDKMRH